MPPTIEPRSRWIERAVSRTGLGAALAVVVALVVGVGVYGLAEVRRLNHEVQDVHQRSVRDLDLIGELQYQAQEARRSVLYALGTTDSNLQVGYADESRAAEAEATSLSEQLAAEDSAPRIKDLLAAFRLRWPAYLEVRDEVLALILEGRVRTAIDLDLAKGKDEFNQARALLIELKQALRAQAADRVAQAHRHANRALRQLAATLAVTLLFAAGAIALVFRLARLGLEQASERRMREVVESISEAMVVLDSAQQIRLWNQPAEELFGVRRTAALGRTLDQVLPDLGATPLSSAVTAAAVQQKMQVIAELPRTHREVTRLYEARIFPFERGVTLFFSDITERKLAEDTRLDLERKLLESQKLESLGMLSGGVAHDFNNLLTAIMGNASLAALEVPAKSEIQDHLKRIQEASREASNLCQQMLAYAGRGRFQVQTVDFNQLVEELHPLLRVSVPRNIELQLELGRDVPPATLDTTQTKQVLLNLVINAAEAIGQKGGRVLVRTRAWRPGGDAAPANNFVLAPAGGAVSYAGFEVADNGCGMDEKTRARIFDPFFTTKFTGRGLGLAAVLGILRGHQGALRLESAPGKGTTFTCYFPAAETPIQAPPTRGSNTPWTGKGKVLVMDDEAAVREVVSRMLQLSGFTPVLACDGQEGLDLFHAAPNDFVAAIVDLTMPRVSGHEALDQMLAVRRDLPAVVISGFSEQEVSARVTARPETIVMQKPFEVAELRERLRVLLCPKARAQAAAQRLAEAHVATR